MGFLTYIHTIDALSFCRGPIDRAPGGAMEAPPCDHRAMLYLTPMVCVCYLFAADAFAQVSACAFVA